MNEIKSTSKYIKISPKKLVLLSKLLKEKEVNYAINLLKFIPKKAAFFLRKTLKSCLYNAKNNYKINNSNLFIDKIIIGKGRFLKRHRPSARGSSKSYVKKTSHLNIILKQKI